MEFEVLGPVRVRQDDRDVPITALKLRTLLGTLIARANNPVSVDRLIDVLWDGKPVDSANKKLQLHVHRLRRGLGESSRIRFEHGGYLLTVKEGELDAECFERRLAAASAATEPSGVVRLLREALALWRGEPFAD